MNELKVFLVFPSGYETLMAFVVAEDAVAASEKAMTIPAIYEVVSDTVGVKVFDIDKAISITGHKLTVEKLGMYH